MSFFNSSGQSQIIRGTHATNIFLVLIMHLALWGYVLYFKGQAHAYLIWEEW